MANWAESICLRCGNKMVTEPCLACTESSRLDDYPGQVRWHISEIEKESKLPFKYHVSRCEECGIEVLIAVENPYLETNDNRIAVMLNGRYVVLSDEVLDEKSHP
jgi:hypothetical protein